MLAKAIGYQPQVIAGRVPGGVDGAPDGFTRHSLVKINGLYYDPEAQFDGWARGVYGLGYYPMYLQILSILSLIHIYQSRDRCKRNEDRQESILW